MKKWMRLFVHGIASIAIIWVGLTFWAELAGKQQIQHFPADNATRSALLLYNPDPIYNLDEQIGLALADELKNHGISSTLATNRKVNKLENQAFDVYIFCANTYNFAPDQGIKNAIRRLNLQPKDPVVAITLGSGSTHRSQKRFERFLRGLGLEVVQSQTFWLLRPNDERRMDESNLQVAVDLAKELVAPTLRAIETN